LPMYQSAAWVANVYQALVAGVPCAIDSHFSASDFWDRTRHYGATVTFTLGAMHMFLWNAPARENDADNPVRSNIADDPREILFDVPAQVTHQQEHFRGELRVPAHVDCTHEMLLATQQRRHGVGSKAHQKRRLSVALRGRYPAILLDRKA